MALSTIDIISPKITLYYYGRKSHISQVGGLLSLFFIIAITLLFFYFTWNLYSPKISSSVIYKQITSDKIFQTLDYSGINHFIQLYSHQGNGLFGDLDNKNIIIYSIRENQTLFYENLSLNLANREHWLYDKCENVYDINKNFFPEISKIIPNYSKTICLRFYYNPSTKKYYEIGFDGYVSPKLETNEIFEKNYLYKIIIEKCINNSFISKKMGFVCNNENEIKTYLNIYTEIFTYFTNNQFIPDNYKSPLEKIFYSVSSTINENAYFENNIIFSPFKLITEKKSFFHKNKINESYILNNHYSNNNILNNKQSTIIGIFNFVLSNNKIIYQRKYINILETLSHLGGLGEILFFILQIINFLNNRYIIIEHTKELFQINTGIDNPSINEANANANEFFFDKRHMTNHNYKIKVFNNNNIINAEDISHKFTKSIYSPDKTKKFKYPFGQKSSKKNIILFPLNNNNLKKSFLSKRSRTKYITNDNCMGKKFTLRREGKRKSYLSQGYRISKDNNSINQSYLDNDYSNNDMVSNNDRRSIIYNSNLIYLKEGPVKHDSIHRGSIENNSIKNRKESKKTKFKLNNNFKNPSIEKGDNVTNIIFKNLESKGRHKSVNFSNQGRLLENNNTNISLNNKYGIGKNSSGFINDSSKQVFLKKNKSIFTLHNNKFNNYENKIDDYYSRIPTLIHNNDYLTNLNSILNNSNNIDPNIFLKNIVHNKLKYINHEGKKNAIPFINFGRKEKFFDFFKSLFIFRRRNENKICLINNFRNKLLSEEHLFRSFINLYLIQKIFQIEETHKFDINELYNNL